MTTGIKFTDFSAISLKDADAAVAKAEANYKAALDAYYNRDGITWDEAAYACEAASEDLSYALMVQSEVREIAAFRHATRKEAYALGEQ